MNGHGQSDGPAVPANRPKEAAAAEAGRKGSLASLFTGDASYLHSPYQEPVTGLEAVKRMWEDDREGPDEVFTLATDILAVDSPMAVVSAEVSGGEAV